VANSVETMVAKKNGSCNQKRGASNIVLLPDGLAGRQMPSN